MSEPVDMCELGDDAILFRRADNSFLLQMPVRSEEDARMLVAHYTEGPTMSDWLIWSNQRGMWWRPLGAGYTAHLGEAGRYEHRDALRIVVSATCGGELSHARTDPVTEQTYIEYDEVMIAAPDE